MTFEVLMAKRFKKVSNQIVLPRLAEDHPVYDEGAAEIFHLGTIA